MFDHLQVRQHAQQTPQQTAVDRLSASLPLNEQQNPVDGFTLDLQVADDVEPEQLQTHVPADQSSSLSASVQTHLCLLKRSSLTRLMAALNFVKHRCDPKTKIYS